MRLMDVRAGKLTGSGGWVTFPREFNRRNYARPVRLVVSAPSGKAAPTLAEHQPLVGVELETRGREIPGHHGWSANRRG